MLGNSRHVAGHGTRLFTAVVAASLCALAAASAAQETRSLDELLPEQTLLYVSYRSPARDQAFRESALGRIMREREMGLFLDDLKQASSLLLEEHGVDLPVAPDLIEEILSNEVSVAFAGMFFEAEGAALPGLALSVVFQRQVEQVEQALLDLLGTVTAGAAAEQRPAFQHQGITVKSYGLPEGRLFYAFLGQRLLVTTSESFLRGILDRAAGGGTALADSPKFRKVVSRAGGPGTTVWAYADTEGLLNLFGASFPPPAAQVIAGLGLRGILAVGLGSRFTDGGIRDSLYLYAPGARLGLLPHPGEGADLSLLQWVPQNARTVSLFRLDLESTYREVMRVVAESDPEVYEEAVAAIAEAEASLGFRIQQDLLASLGAQYLFFEAPHETVLAVEVKDRNRFEACVGSLIELAGGKAVLERMDYEGADIRYLCVTEIPLPVSPSYTFYNEFAVIGLYPQTVKSFLTRMKGAGPSILENADFQRVASRYLDGCNYVSYGDISGGLANFYSFLLLASPALRAVPGISIRPELLPPVSAIEPHLFGMGGGCTNDEDGLLYESFAPFGAASGLLAVTGSMRAVYGTNIYGPAMMAAMLMPALGRARVEARRAACKNNLHSIGIGIVLYRNDFEQRFPESLAELIPVYVEYEGVFLCPEDMDPMELGEGIRCSYHYVGRLAPDTDPMVIIVYDKRGNHPDGRNALFADTHVEQISEEQFAARLQESLRLVKEGGWDLYSPQRQQAIEAFYRDEAQP